MKNLPTIGSLERILPSDVAVEQALIDDCQMHGFISRGAECVVRIGHETDGLVGYGEGTCIEEAIAYATLTYYMNSRSYIPPTRTNNEEILYITSDLFKTTSRLNELIRQITSTKRSEQFTQYGRTFRAYPQWGGVSCEAVDNLSSNAYLYRYTKTGRGRSFANTVLAMLRAPEIEVYE